MRTVVLLSIVFSLRPCIATAQENAFDPSKALAPYIDEFTYAIGCVDVQNIDLDRMIGRLTRVGAPEKEMATIKATAAMSRETLIKAGARYVCFEFNMADSLGDGPLLVIPIAPGGDPAKVAALFKMLPRMSTNVRDRAVLVGSAATTTRAVARVPGAVPMFAKALAAVDPLPTRIALVMPSILGKAIEEAAPRLPKMWGGGPIAPVTRGVDWAAIGLDLSEDNLKMRAIVQAKDAQAAARLSQLADRGLAFLRAEAKAQNANALLKGLDLLRPKTDGKTIRVALDAAALDTAILPLIAKVREQASRAQSVNNLKQIALAMHIFHDTFKSFPAQASFDKQQKPLLSWRVHLLPFLDQDELYKQFKLDEPWDSPANKPLVAKMPVVYRSPLIVNAAAGKTTYLVPVGPDLVFDGPKKMKITQINDGTANTILVVEAAESRSVYWTQPEDYPVNRKDPKTGLINPGDAGFLTAFADGSVRFLPRTVPDTTMWLYFCPNDRTPIPPEKSVDE